MDKSSKLFPYELYLGFTLLKIVPQGQEVLDITWSIYYLIQKPNANTYQQSMRYNSEEKMQIKGHGDIICRIKLQ